MRCQPKKGLFPYFNKDRFLEQIYWRREYDLISLESVKEEKEEK
jgi:hypothetical protein